MAQPTVMRPLTEVEAAEFRGLFFGEGHLDLIKSARSKTLIPRARIAVRDDDAAVVEWCRDLFGGNLSRRASTRSVCWQLTGRVRVAHLLAVLEGGVMPSRKREEVAVIRTAYELGADRGQMAPPGARERLFVLREDLKALRAYRPVVMV